MSYEQLSQFAGSWGLVFLVVMFLVSLVYALWPGNADQFRHAAHLPLNDEDIDPSQERQS